MARLSTAVCCIWMMMPATAVAASFDCAKASAVIEMTICADADLNAADTLLGKSYGHLRKLMADNDKKRLQAEQRKWLKTRTQHCQASDPSCLLTVYKARNRVLSELLRTVLYRTLSWPADCEESWQTAGAGYGDSAGLTFLALGDDRYLVEVLCSLGAYQAAFVVAYLDERSRSGHVMSFDDYRRNARDQLQASAEKELVGWSSFDQDTKTYAVTTKYRGVGGCGKRSTYLIRRGRAILQEIREMNCEEADKIRDEDSEIGPDSWPVIYPG